MAPRRARVRRPTASHTWEVARQDTTCELHQGTIHRGALLLVKRPGRIRACQDCARRFWRLTPPPGVVEQAPDLWKGPDGRVSRIPESDR